MENRAECNEENGEWRESARKNRGSRNRGGSRALSDGFHVWMSGAELAPGGCGWTLMRKVLLVMEEAYEPSTESQRRR